jgi:hypothetical protein
MAIDLVLIHPCSRRQVYQSLADSLAAVEPPVWAGLLATYARKKGFSVALLDGDADELSMPRRWPAASPSYSPPCARLSYMVTSPRHRPRACPAPVLLPAPSASASRAARC